MSVISSPLARLTSGSRRTGRGLVGVARLTGGKVGRAAASAVEAGPRRRNGGDVSNGPRRLPPSWRGGRLGPGDPRCGRAPSPHPGEASLRRRGVARACVSIGSRRRACRRSRFQTTGASP